MVMNNITQLIVVHIIYTILINNFTYMCVYTLKTSGLLIVNKTKFEIKDRLPTKISRKFNET